MLFEIYASKYYLVSLILYIHAAKAGFLFKTDIFDLLSFELCIAGRR